jgi:hypothetical protein
LEGCALEFPVIAAGFLSLAGEVITLLVGKPGFCVEAAGAGGFVVAVEDAPPLFGGTTCTTRGGAAVPGGVAGAAAEVEGR